MPVTKTIGAVVASITVPTNFTYTEEGDKLLELMTRKFNGVTTREVVGTYVREDNGKVDVDTGYEISAWVPRKEVKDGQDFTKGLAQMVLRNTDEEAVLWTYGGVAYLEMRD